MIVKIRKTKLTPDTIRPYGKRSRQEDYNQIARLPLNAVVKVTLDRPCKAFTQHVYHAVSKKAKSQGWRIFTRRANKRATMWYVGKIAR